MPDTLDQPGFDPEKHIIGEEAIAAWREVGINTAGAILGDTQVARLRSILLTMIATAAMSTASPRVRLVGLLALMLALADALKRR